MVVSLFSFLFKGFISSVIDLLDHIDFIKDTIGKDNSIQKMDKDNGEGSSKSPNAGKYSPIGYDDYLYSDSSDNEDINKSNQNKPLVPPKSETVVFKEIVDQTPTQEVANKLDELTAKLEEFKKSGSKVPAAKDQMDILQKKIDICIEKISQDLESSESEGTKSKNKGKQPER